MENELVKYKWVRIMSDYCADGIWSKDGGGEDIDSLPVSVKLKNDLLSWQMEYDFNYDSMLDIEISEFSIKGLKIAKRVKEELPDWVVIYFDIYKSLLYDPRSYYQYEI
jgi:hypothetical protein